MPLLPTTVTEIAFASSPYASSPTWVNISRFVREMDIAQGRTHVGARVEAGRMTAVLDDSDARFHPMLTGGPYGSNILPMKRVRVRAGYNLLTANQSSAETNTTGTAAANCTITRVTTVAASGSGCFQMQASSAALMRLTADGAAPTAIPVSAGATYTAMAAFRSAVTKRPARVDMFWYNSSGTAIGSSSSAFTSDTTTGWTFVTLTAAAPATAAFVVFGVQIGDGSSNPANAEVHYVDCLGVYAGTLPPSINLLTPNNVGFETSMGEWSPTGCTATSDATQSLFGLKSAKLTKTGGAGDMEISLPTAAVAVVANTRYSSVASFLASPSGGPRNCLVKINWYDASNANIGAVSGPVVVDSVDPWQTAGLTAVSPPTAVTASLELIVKAAANGEVHYIDKVALAAVA